MIQLVLLLAALALGGYMLLSSQSEIGSAFFGGSTKAAVNNIKSQAQQITAANALRYATTGDYAFDIQDLVDEGYLNSIPSIRSSDGTTTAIWGVINSISVDTTGDTLLDTTLSNLATIDVTHLGNRVCEELGRYAMADSDLTLLAHPHMTGSGGVSAACGEFDNAGSPNFVILAR